MHSSIKILVYAKSEEEARGEAEQIIGERMTGNGGHFDYVSVETVKLASSDEGKSAIALGMKWTKENFIEAIKEVRKRLKRYTNEQLYLEDKALDTRFYCHKAGEYAGRNVFIYDQDGEGIREPKHLKNVLTKWRCLGSKSNEYDDKDIYVVETDAHS